MEINTRCEFLCRECGRTVVPVAMGICDACVARPPVEPHPAVRLLRLIDQASMVFEHRFAEAPIMEAGTLSVLREAFQKLRNFTLPLVWAADDAAAKQAKERVAAKREAAERDARLDAELLAGLTPEELTEFDILAVRLVRGAWARHARRREKTCDPT